MDFKIVWTEHACEDLGAIVRYIARHNSSTVAKEIGFGLYNRVQILTSHPEAGSFLLEKDDPTWRKLIYKTWKIIYRVDSSTELVYITRIWHAAKKEISIKQV